MYTLVIGASENPARYSYKAIKALLANDRPVKAYGLKKGNVDGVSFITEKAAMSDIETVTLYVGPRHQSDLFEFIIQDIHPKRIIFNPGTENPEFYKLAEAAGIVCQEACTLVLLATHQYDEY